MPSTKSSIRSIEEAGTYLASLINLERRPDFSYKRLGLEPIRRLLEQAGNPHHGLSVVHVAGSKGKGSTALLAEAILEAAGDRVGTFTSPHLERWTERFRIGGREVSESALACAVDQLRPHIDHLRGDEPEQAPTFFDATTAVALWLFREAAVRRVILEVGLGGRLDSTNIVAPAVCCITGVELEHTDKLGSTLSEIAGEKAGIIKPGVPVVTGDLAPDAAAVVEACAGRAGAPLFRLGREFHRDLRTHGQGGVRFAVRDGAFEAELELPILGAHHADNAALAIACIRRLPDGPDDRTLGRVAARALARVELPGRIEVVGRHPWQIVDGAHTIESAKRLAAALSTIERECARLVISVSAGKDLGAILGELLPSFDEVYATTAEPTRSIDPEKLAAAVRVASPDTPVRIFADPIAAVRSARAASGEHDLLCTTGSIYLAGIGRRVLGERPGTPD